MQFDDYAAKYSSITFSREGGVLTPTMHTRGGPAQWGMSLTSLQAELPNAFLDVARDPDNKVVTLTGTGDSVITGFDREGCSTSRARPKCGRAFTRKAWGC